MADFNAAIIKTLAKEGGDKYTETPGDNGGATKYGISKRSYPHLDIRNITEQQARDIYKRDYWDRVCGDRIASQVIAENLFDTAVNMGLVTAIKLAQTTANEILRDEVAVDGVMGVRTIAAIEICPVTAFLAGYTLAKIARYAHICNRDKTQSKFLLGWINRALGGA